MITSHESIPIPHILSNYDLPRKRLLRVQDPHRPVFDRVRRYRVQVQLLAENEDQEWETEDDEQWVDIVGESSRQVHELFAGGGG